MTAHHGQHDQSDHRQQATTGDFTRRRSYQIHSFYGKWPVVTCVTCGVTGGIRQQMGRIDLITGPCACISASRVDNPRQHRCGLSASAPVEYQARNRSPHPARPAYQALAVSITAGRIARSPVFAGFHASSRRLICALGRPWEGRKDIYARGLPHSKSFLGSNGAHQARAALAKRGHRQRYAGFRPSDPGWVPGGRKTEAPAVDRRASPISRIGFRKSGRACSEKVGRPVNPPPVTQGSGWIRQIALTATHLAQNRKHAPAANSESRRGMSL
jgi:hypothetical protein